MNRFAKKTNLRLKKHNNIIIFIIIILLVKCGRRKIVKIKELNPLK